LIRELKDAGLVSFTLHIDSHQKRPDWLGKNEAELNELRLHLARMVHEAGDGQIACGFNATIYRDTLEYIPALTKWAQDHIDIVSTMVYILYRSAKSQGNFETFVHGKIVDPTQLVYQLDSQEEHVDVMTDEVVDKIREASPDYEPCAFLSGTEDTRALKWLIGTRVGDKERIWSYLDSKFSEFVQISHHFLFGTYLAYTRPCLLKRSQVIFPLSMFSKGARKVLGQWLLRPSAWLKPLYMQTILIIQPVDVFADGRISMCDGCPDAMIYQGRLVWKCRVDELAKFGGYIQCVPGDKSAG
jgi:hypothetical protein